MDLNRRKILEKIQKSLEPYQTVLDTFDDSKDEYLYVFIPIQSGILIEVEKQDTKKLKNQDIQPYEIVLRPGVWVSTRKPTLLHREREVSFIKSSSESRDRFQVLDEYWIRHLKTDRTYSFKEFSEVIKICQSEYTKTTEK